MRYRAMRNRVMWNWYFIVWITLQCKLRLRRLCNISDRRYLIFVMDSFHCLTTHFCPFTRLQPLFTLRFPVHYICLYVYTWFGSFLFSFFRIDRNTTNSYLLQLDLSTVCCKRRVCVCVCERVWRNAHRIRSDVAKCEQAVTIVIYFFFFTAPSTFFIVRVLHNTNTIYDFD